uniref:GIY-YIG domain-containing protein n=1 Tax=viral metagenome TaxID=1070528 RepID=A0A6C0HGT7_9ZZZZ
MEKVEKVKKTEEPWLFYIVHNNGYTYAGVSPDPVKRLRKHNGELAGGAKYTLGKGKGWEHVCLISGFQTKQQALQFEWASKHVPPRNVGGLEQRVKKLYILLNKSQWTSKAIEAHKVPLKVEWKMKVPCANRTVPSYILDIEHLMINSK